MNIPKGYLLLFLLPEISNITNFLLLEDQVHSIRTSYKKTKNELLPLRCAIVCNCKAGHGYEESAQCESKLAKNQLKTTDLINRDSFISEF